MNNECEANYLNKSNNVTSLCSIGKCNLNKVVVADLNINLLSAENNSKCQHRHDT